jgi:flagellar hook-associated protein 1
MSFAATMNNGMSGMRAAQAGLAVASQNIANANTPGYVRVQANFASQQIAGKGGGVVLQSVTRVADQFLAASFHHARGAEAGASAHARLMDGMQALFGDPSSDSSTFAMVDAAYRAFAEAAIDPSSPIGRREAVLSLDAMFKDFNRVAEGIESLRLEADTRVSEAVGRMDELLSQIHALNTDVASAKGLGSDSTGAENTRGQLVDELAGLIDIRIGERTDGRLEIRTQTGLSLIGADRVKVSYTPSPGSFAVPGQISALSVSGEVYPLDPHIQNGEIAGLIKARDVDIPGLAEGLGVLSDTISDELNRLHAVQTSLPPAREVQGRQTGLLGSDPHNFTGQSVVAVLNERGELQRRITIDFDSGEVRLQQNQTAPPTVVAMGATLSDVGDALNTALGTVAGTARFEDGAMSIAVPSGYGLAFGEVAGDESARAGRGFAHFFGLNELARRPMTSMGDTGMKPADAHGLEPGGELKFRAMDATGRIVAERTVAVTGSSWADMMGAINGGGSGLAPFGGVRMDLNGRMTMAASPGYRIDVLGDSTTRGGPDGASMTEIFGLAPGDMARRAMSVGVNPELSADPRRLGVSAPDLSAPLGARVLEVGDGRGASRLAQVREVQASFVGAGAIGAHRTTLGAFTQRLGSEAGRLATLSQRQADGAESLARVSSERRAAVEGVSIDDEVIRMNAYQQAYSAAARIIQAANEMWQTLLAIR